ncbi:7818_t:CDS:1 [Paraglomus occultum]|uniref:Phosphatidylglycerol/phosphatidylinositol transfer protein n=1 Tax=Paraglomus occultum TaxID=144539 RepID=A0A9N9CJC5_9GLOM|nr:7818_t:CDS:1 [Paraglomus occultum]
MKHSILFLLVVLATISVISATSMETVAQFRPCNLCSHSKALNVTLSPYTIVPGKAVTFNISGTAATKIPKDSTVEIKLFNGDDFKKTFSGNFCKLSKSKCPVKQGTVFDLLHKITPKKLPKKYFIQIKILDPQRKQLMCSTNKHRLFNSNSYSNFGSNSNSGSKSGSKSGSNAGSNSGSTSDSIFGSIFGSHSGSNSDSNSGPIFGSHSGSNSDSNSHSGSNFDLIC